MKNYFSDLELILEEMVNYLKRYPISLSNNNRDGRVNSIDNEDEIINKLKENVKFQKLMYIPEARCWFDFSIKYHDKAMPVNIKVSNFDNSAADNLSSKQGMAFALTGDAQVSNSWNEFSRQVADELQPGFDYYYLVINKNNPADCYWTSMKRIETLTPNGNNLPFQCNWSKNREFANRDEEKATRYILNTFLESWNKKISGYPREIQKIVQRKDIFKKDQ